MPALAWQCVKSIRIPWSDAHYRCRSAGSGGGADMSLIDADSPKNVHSGVSVTDILFGHGRTRKNVNTGRLQTLPQNGQLEWKCGDLSTSIGVVKRASSNSSVQRFMRSASLASASAEGRTRQDSVGSHGMSSDSVDGKATSKGIHSAILATSSLDDMPLRSNMPASTGRENLQSASMNYAQDLSAEDGGRASRTWPGRAKASTFDTVSASSGNNKGDVTPTDFAALTKQQQGTRLRQVKHTPPTLSSASNTIHPSPRQCSFSLLQSPGR